MITNEQDPLMSEIARLTKQRDEAYKMIRELCEAHRGNRPLRPVVKKAEEMLRSTNGG